MTRKDFREALKVAVLSVATRFNREFADDEVELNEYIDDLMHELSVGQLANLPKALAQWRREQKFFPQTGEIRSLARGMKIDEKYMRGIGSNYQKLLNASINAGSQPAKLLRSLQDVDIQDEINRASRAMQMSEMQRRNGVQSKEVFEQRLNELRRQAATLIHTETQHNTGDLNVKERSQERAAGK